MKLATLLGNNHPNFALTMNKLEQASGNSGIDARLVADINESAHGVMRDLQLDPSDTHAKELYHALNEIVRSGNLKLLANTQYVLHIVDDEIVSFNLHDVIENTHHQLEFRTA